MKKYLNENNTSEGWDDWKGEITDWDNPKYADDADWGRSEAQTIDAHKTSQNQLPNSVLKMRDHNDWVNGNVNFNMGGGYTDNVQNWLSGKTKGIKGFRANQHNDIDYGVTDLVFDPFSRDNDYNLETIRRVEELGGAHTVTCNNVLNVVDSKQEIYNIIQRCAEVLRPDGVAYFITYENGGKGIGTPTTAGYQQSKKTVKYVPLIHKFFDKVKLEDGVIVAKNPIPQDESANWYMNANDSLNQTNPYKLNLKRESKKNKIDRIIKESIQNFLVNEIQVKQFTPYSEKDREENFKPFLGGGHFDDNNYNQLMIQKAKEGSRGAIRYCKNNRLEF